MKMRSLLLFGAPRATAAPVDAPSILAPETGDSQGSDSTVFRWTAAGRADTYRIQFASDAGFTSIVQEKAGLRAPRYAVGGLYLDPELAYFWRVRTENELGVGAWTTARVILPYWKPLGFGALVTTGGTGGTVLEVTNLNDTGAGSLRDALTATGTRIVLITTTGTINLASRIIVYPPDFTLICVNAGGITVKGQTVELRGTSGILNCYVRNIHFRVGIAALDTGTADGLQIGASRFVVDHCSAAFGKDETISVYNAADGTVQNCIAAYGLDNGVDPIAASKGIMVRYDATRITLYRNYTAHCNVRVPMVMGGQIEVINNVTYNALYAMSFQPQDGHALFADFIENYVKHGPETDVYTDGQHTPGLNVDAIPGSEADLAASTLYLRGNLANTRRLNTDPENYFLHVSQRSAPQLVTTQHYNTGASDQAVAADLAMLIVLGTAGASPRDAIDSQAVADFSSGTDWWGTAGGVIDTDSQVGMTPPARPILTFPSVGQILVNDTPTLTWTQPYGDPAPTYLLQVTTAADTGFAAVVYSASGLTGTSHAVATPLTHAADYIWKVTASNILATRYSLTGSFSIPAYDLGDDFNRADTAAGAVGNSWVGAGAAIVSQAMIITPTESAELILNGDFASWSGGEPVSWTASNTADNDVTEVGTGLLRGGGGTGSANIWRNGSAGATTTTMTQAARLTLNGWHKATGVISAVGAGTLRMYDSNFIANMYPASVGTFKVSGRAISTTFLFAGTGTGHNITVDQIGVKELTVSTLFAIKDWGAGAELGSLQFNMTQAAGLWAGVAHYVDDSNFVIAIHNGFGEMHLIKRVAGTYTAVANASVSFVAGAPAIKLVRESGQYDVYYNGSIRISNAAVADAVFNTVTKWGAFSTGEAVFDNALFDIIP